MSLIAWTPSEALYWGAFLCLQLISREADANDDVVGDHGTTRLKKVSVLLDKRFELEAFQLDQHRHYCLFNISNSTEIFKRHSLILPNT